MMNTLLHKNTYKPKFCPNPYKTTSQTPLSLAHTSSGTVSCACRWCHTYQIWIACWWCGLPHSGVLLQQRHILVTI